MLFFEEMCFMVLLFIVIEIAKSDAFEPEVSMLFPYTFIVTLNCSAQPLSFCTSRCPAKSKTCFVCPGAFNIT